MTRSLHAGKCSGLDCHRCYKIVFDLDYRAYHAKAHGLTDETVAAWLEAHPDFAAKHDGTIPSRRRGEIFASDPQPSDLAFGCCGDDTSGQWETAPKRRPVFEWVSTRRLAGDTRLLAGRLPPKLAGVAGVPRSGLIPAAILAAELHLPLYTVAEHTEPVRLAHGRRGNTFGFTGHVDRAAPLLIVDDTVYGGAAMGRIRGRFAGHNWLYAAVYVRPGAETAVDFYGYRLPSPHLLEWNLFNSGPLIGKDFNTAMHGGVAVDFDGVLCRDNAPSARQALPLSLPRTLPVPAIITGRSEEARGESEAWLRRWGAKWQKLVMRPDSVPFTEEAIARWKGEQVRTGPWACYIESSPLQARIIAEVSGKPVICPPTEQVFQ